MPMPRELTKTASSPRPKKDPRDSDQYTVPSGPKFFGC